MNGDSDITERPPRRGRERSREAGGVAELPWPDDKDKPSEAERQEARESQFGDRKPEAKSKPQSETHEAVERPEQRSFSYRRVSR